MTLNSAPASGRPESPTIFTGVEGGASLMRWPLSLTSARIFAQNGPHDDAVAHVKRALAHQHGGGRSHARLDLRLDHVAFGGHFRARLQFHDLGLQQNHLQQRIDALLRGRRNLDGNGVAAPGFGAQAVFLQLLLHAVGIRRRQIAFVDGDDDRHLRRFGVIDGFDRLRHDAVIRGHDQHRDVRDIGAARPHLRERLVAGRVEERDRLAVREAIPHWRRCAA